MFHVWGEGPSGPGEDLITPFEVVPAASPEDPNPMTVVDLRDYASELSLPEGDDKPYKYPNMYRGVNALVINKVDLLPYIPFKMDYFRKGVEVLNPNLVTFPLSCANGEGVEEWVAWIIAEVEANKKLRHSGFSH